MAKKKPIPEETRVNRAKSRLLMTAPFFGFALLRYPIEFTSRIPTACTNGKRISWNPDFSKDLPPKEIEAILAHEVLHILLMHPLRMKGKNHALANQAADYVINDVLRENGFTLAEGLDWRHVPALHSVFKANPTPSLERVYDALNKPEPPTEEKSEPEQGDGDGDGDGESDQNQNEEQGNGGESGEGESPTPGNEPGEQPAKPRQPTSIGEIEEPTGDDGQPLDANEAKKLENEIRSGLFQAADAAKKIGKEPGGMQRIINDALFPKRPVKELLQEFLSKSKEADSSWSRPNRRHIHNGMYLPSAQDDDQLNHLIVAVDTSGSIGETELSQFAGFIHSCAAEIQIEKITVLYCDTHINHVDIFENGEPVKLAPHGGGGTDFSPPFFWIDQNEEETPDCMIYLTDLFGSCHAPEPDYPVLWVRYITEWGSSNYNPPFGQVVNME